MTKTHPVHREYVRRLDQVPAHGLGLSVDVYSPDLASLLRAMRQRQVLPAYLEVFRAIPAALKDVRRQVGHGLMTYHGEGLWLTQPEAADDAVFRQEVCEVASHLQALQCAWLNHECATKHMAGYSYGTYLPPLYTEASAEVVADNVILVQHLLDQHSRLDNGGTPLMLLELPPLTYFVAGTLTIPEFFRILTEKAPCGLVLDVGHLWTVYRYTGAWQSMPLPEFVDSFLQEFPMERVVEIHVAGLAIHESGAVVQAESRTAGGEEPLPAWTDAHAAPIPPVLFEMLDQILGHAHLTGLKGLALEVDTKSIELIVDEFARFSQRYAAVAFSTKADSSVILGRMDAQIQREPVPDQVRHRLGKSYEQYASVVTGRAEPHGPEWSHRPACLEGLETYRSVYLPYEILHWGGRIEDMFPELCRRFTERGVSLSRFVPFWFREPRPQTGTYDFFILKIERFVEFVREEAPDLVDLAESQAEELRQAYGAANEPVDDSGVELA